MNRSSEEGNAPTQQTQLQSKLRLFARGYLQENLANLQALPTADEFEKLKAERRKELREKIEREKQASKRSLELQQSPRKLSTTPAKAPSPAPQVAKAREATIQDGGWAPSDRKQRTGEVDDPILQQMNNIKEYIVDAKRADRWDEVATLESNLRELQNLYALQQKQARVTQSKQSTRTPDANTHPILQQIKHVQQLMREAAREGRKDDVALFQQNVLQLQVAYREEQSGHDRSAIQSPLQN